MKNYKAIAAWFTAAAFVLAGASAPATVITWNPAGPTVTTSANDISLNGTLVHAGDFWANSGGIRSVTVGAETIIFTNRPAGTTDGYAGITGSVGSGGGPSITGFNLVLTEFAWTFAATQTLTLQGLIPGDHYQVQLFVGDTRVSSDTRTMAFSDHSVLGIGNDTASFYEKDNNYVIGTFVADGGSVQIYGIGTGGDGLYPILNAYILRDTLHIPEPSSIALLALGSLMFWWRRRGAAPAK